MDKRGKRRRSSSSNNELEHDLEENEATLCRPVYVRRCKSLVTEASLQRLGPEEIFGNIEVNVDSLGKLETDENDLSTLSSVSSTTLTSLTSPSFSFNLNLEESMNDSVGLESPNVQQNMSQEEFKNNELLKQGGIEIMQELDMDLEEEVDHAQCFICMEEFSESEERMCIPCSNGCNRTPVHPKCIYEWKQSQRNKSQPGDLQNVHPSNDCDNLPNASCPLCRGPLGKFSYFPPDIIRSSNFGCTAAKRDFMYYPAPQEAGYIRCFIKAYYGRTPVKSNFLQIPGAEEGSVVEAQYELYLQAPTTLKYPLGPVPNAYSPHEGDKLLAVVNKIRVKGKNITGRVGSNDVSALEILLTPGHEGPLGAVSDFRQEGFMHLATMKHSLATLRYVLKYPYMLPGGNDGKMALRVSELAAVQYLHHTTNHPGPKTLQVGLPAVVKNNNTNDVTKRWSTTVATDVSLSLSNRLRNKLGRNGGKSDIATDNRGNKNGLYLVSKRPSWLEHMNAYTLDFKGRVTLPSNKNFQLLVDKSLSSPDVPGNETQNSRIEVDNEAWQTEQPASASENDTVGGNDVDSDVILQFGKVGENNEKKCEVYTLDFKWPLSPLQAFGICLSTCDRHSAF